MKITIASYNIMHGGLSDYDMAKLTESIALCHADIIGVQEVDVDAKRSGNRNIAQLMAQELGYEYRFAKAIDFQGGAYGTAILSRYPIVDFSCYPLESGKYEKRSVGCADIKIDEEIISFWNTHVSYENTEQRGIQLAQLKQLLPKDRAWILTGDFNTADFEEIRALGDVSLVNDTDHVFHTFRDTGSPIDNIVYTAPWKIERAGMIDNDHSDHNLLYAVMDLPMKGE